MSKLTPVKEPEEEKGMRISRFIDIEKDKSRFYTNIFLKNEDLVIKSPFPLNAQRDDSRREVRIENFDLTKYIYLTDY
jgi:hypothetical protein